jgi:hypothetical protein
LALLLLSVPLISAAQEIPSGAHALLRLMNTVSTRTAREGDYVYMQTATPIVSAGRVVVPQGSYAQGVVTRSRRSGRVSGKAELAIRLDAITLPGGRVIAITPRLDSVDAAGTEQKVDPDEHSIKQGGSVGSDAARVATVGASGAAIGSLVDRTWTGAGIGAGAGGALGLATVLLSRGREIELRQGSTVDVVFEKPVRVD